MGAHVEARVLDNGLSVLDTEATHVYICGTEPTTYLQASSTYALGSKNWGAGNVFGSPAAGGATNSRKVTSAAITDGAVSTGGTAAWAAVVDGANSRLLAVVALAASQVVTAGNPFTLAAFDVQLAGQ